MERESAVREILQSIGPLFPEDAERARAERRGLNQVAPAAATGADPASRPQMTAAPKPVLASQVDAPHLKKTPVSTLAAVLERLAPRPAPPSLRETVPGLVRAAPPRMDTEVNAVRAALEEKTVRAAPVPPRAEQPAVETIAIQSAPAPAPAVVGEAPAAVAGPTVAVKGKPEVAAPVVEAPVAEAVSEPVAPVVAEVVAVPETPAEDVAEPELPLNGAEPVAKVVQPEAEPVAVEAAVAEPADPELPFSEEEHDAFVAAVADALATTNPPVPEVAQEMVAPVVRKRAGKTAAPATVTAISGGKRAGRRAAAKSMPAAASVTEAAPAAVAAPEPAVKAESAKPAKTAKAAEPTKAPEPAKARDTSAPAPAVAVRVRSSRVPNPNDELIRQIETHRADLIDVDEQLARLDEQITACKQEMARHLELIAVKGSRRDRLVRLRKSTLRFVETLQIKTAPVKQRPQRQKKSA